MFSRVSVAHSFVKARFCEGLALRNREPAPAGGDAGVTKRLLLDREPPSRGRVLTSVDRNSTVITLSERETNDEIRPWCTLSRQSPLDSPRPRCRCRPWNQPRRSTARHRCRGRNQSVGEPTSDQRRGHGGKRSPGIALRVGRRGSVGYALPNGLRFEIEGDHRNNQFATDATSASRLARGRENKDADVQRADDMTNLLAQTTGLAIPDFAPYVGVGVGYQWAH